MTVILVRHGETDSNRTVAFRGRINMPLNERGRLQARRIARKLWRTRIDACYSSPLVRARETAEIAIEDHGGTRVQIIDSLVDMNFGEWQGMTLPEVELRFPDALNTWKQSPERVEIPGGEGLRSVRMRAVRALNDIQHQHSKSSDSTVVIVSHGLVNKVLLCAVLGLSNSHFWRIKQDVACINVFEYAPEGSKILLLNDISHICKFSKMVHKAKALDNPIAPLAVNNTVLTDI